MTEYHKLIRDGILQIIKSSGESPVTRVLNEEEYRKALVDKLVEESAEFKEKPSVEELADVQEVIGALCLAYGFDPVEVETVRKAKASERGGFEGRIFLERTES